MAVTSRALATNTAPMHHRYSAAYPRSAAPDGVRPRLQIAKGRARSAWEMQDRRWHAPACPAQTRTSPETQTAKLDHETLETRRLFLVTPTTHRPCAPALL